MNEARREPRHVVIAGGSGFLGRSLTAYCLERGDRVTILSRSREPGDASQRREGVSWRQWDAKTLGDWTQALDAADAVVNYVGRSVDCRKTPENRRLILASRVDSCRVLGEAMRQVQQPPPVWVQSATAHIVGDPVPEDTLCDETTPPGPQHELAPSVGVAWEQAFDDARLPEQRGVKLRISFVLGPGGGAMQRLTKLTKLGLGGTVGSGNQWVSWIHVHDLNRLVDACISDASYEGVYMVTAPQPVTNRTFMCELRKAFGRPWSPPAPAPAVRIASRFLLDTDPELALLGRRCVPTRLVEEHGFSFAFSEISSAVRDVAERG